VSNHTAFPPYTPEGAVSPVDLTAHPYLDRGHGGEALRPCAVEESLPVFVGVRAFKHHRRIWITKRLLWGDGARISEGWRDGEGLRDKGGVWLLSPSRSI
jgi:hypothetical protein